MADRELMERLAAAAGKDDFAWNEACGAMQRSNGRGGFWSGHEWQPLDDDGASQRLAVLMEMTVVVNCREGFTEAATPTGETHREPHNGDPAKATRMAIAMAAIAANNSEREHGESQFRIDAHQLLFSLDPRHLQILSAMPCDEAMRLETTWRTGLSDAREINITQVALLALKVEVLRLQEALHHSDRVHGRGVAIASVEHKVRYGMESIMGAIQSVPLEQLARRISAIGDAGAFRQSGRPAKPWADLKPNPEGSM